MVVNRTCLQQQVLGFCSEINSSTTNPGLHFSCLVNSQIQSEKTEPVTSVYPQLQREKCLGQEGINFRFQMRTVYSKQSLAGKTVVPRNMTSGVESKVPEKLSPVKASYKKPPSLFGKVFLRKCVF